MRRWSALLFVAFFAASVMATDAIDSPSYTFTNALDDSAEYFTTASPFAGTTLVFTNMICLDTDNASTQGLDGCYVTFQVGTEASSVCYTGTVQDVSPGTSNGWNCSSITVPSSMPVWNVQVTISNDTPQVRIYPWKKCRATAVME